MFPGENFLLQSKTGQKLYHEAASDMPIFDYHCHLIPDQISRNRQFENMTKLWLEGDHYKWRALRANGISEDYITGNRSDREKFRAWAETVPMCLGNPLYHWNCLELKKPFGITDKLLNAETADEIYDRCNEKLAEEDFRVFGIMKKFNVTHICTTDDPVDNLEHHKIIKDTDCPAKIYPAFRPDRAVLFNRPEDLKNYLEDLEEASGINIKDYDSFIDAIDNRHEFFHQNGCRLADHGLEDMMYLEKGSKTAKELFADVLDGKKISDDDDEFLQTAVMIEIGRMHSRRGWVMQLHIGALRDTNTRMLEKLGPNTGYDTIGKSIDISKVAKFFDSLDKTDQLPKTILYILNPADNYTAANIIGCFQNGNPAGKMQYGSGWWFLDQKEGMEQQMKALSLLGLLSRFVGMLTDSRSFVSYSRHEYFRRILCNMIGTWADNGEIPNDFSVLKKMVEDISYNNALGYFDLP